MNAPIITVIVPVWNGEAQIGLCLDALSVQSLPREYFEVIVVDNGSTDRTVEVIKTYDFVRLLSEPEAGSYNARNTGVDAAGGTYLAFTDADCIPHVDWLARIKDAFIAQPDIGIVAGKIELFRASAEDSATCEAYENLFLLNQEKTSKEGGCATANWSSPRDLIVRLGKFNGRMKSGGDFEMSQRILKSGGRIVYFDNVVVRHPIRGQIADVLKKRVRVVGGQWTKKKDSVSALSFSLRLVIDGIKASLTVIRKGPPDLLLRLKLVLLLIAVVFVGVKEHLRLLLGGEAKRS